MSSNKNNQVSVVAISSYVMMALSLVGTVLVLSWLLKYCAYGIDFTDESFYLVWMSNPFVYNYSVTQFGFFYHPLYILLGGDIVTLRRVNVLITFALACGLVFSLLISLSPDSRKKSLALYTATVGFAISVFFIFGSWLPTPSYNNLALQGLIVTSIGLLFSEKTMVLQSIIGWITIGVGGWMAFMAKPSTALALAVGVFVCLFFSRKFSVRLMLLSVASIFFLFLVTALLIDGSVLGFIRRLQLGVEFVKYLEGGHSFDQILRLDSFRLNKTEKIVIFFVFAISLFSAWGAWIEKKKWLLGYLPLSFAFFTLTVLLALGEIHQVLKLGQFQGLLIFGVAFAIAIAGLVFYRIRALNCITASEWSIAGLFLVMPHIYAFGTNTNYWRTGSSAGIFWLLASVILLKPLVRERSSWLFALPFVFATQAVAAILLQTGIEQPYRQPQPLRLNASPMEIGIQRSTLVLSKSYSEYVYSAVSTARDVGFEPTTSVIDLSGQSPGILYMLGAENIGQAWTIGGYHGSLRLAKAALGLTSCEKISKAWILFEPDGPRSIPTELLTSLGAIFPEGYELAGTWQTAEGAGGYAVSRTQEFYKPTAIDKTLRDCTALRERYVE